MIGLIPLAALDSCVVFPLIVLVLSIRNLRYALRVTDQPIDSIETLRTNYRELLTREEEALTAGVNPSPTTTHPVILGIADKGGR